MQKRNPAQQRYVVRFIPTMFSYVLVLFAATYLIRFWHPTGIALAARVLITWHVSLKTLWQN